LILALKEKFPSLSPIGLGGSAMVRAGLQPYNVSAPPENPLNMLHELDWRHVLEFIDRSQPRLVILTPGFEKTTVLLEALVLRRIPVVFYGAPAVFSWPKTQWQSFTEQRPLVLGFFPFERPLFESYGVAYRFVGNPLRDRMAKVTVDLDTFSLKKSAESWLLFKCPTEEDIFQAVFPVFWRMATSFAHQAPDWTVVFNFMSDRLATALHLGGKTFAPFMQNNTRGNIKVIRDMSHELTKLSDLVVTTGGMESLEVAMMETPGIAITHEIAAQESAWPRFGCLANAVLDQAVMPEVKLSQSGDLLTVINRLLSHQDDLLRQRQIFRDMRSNLEGFAAENAALAIIALLQQTRRP
jgi:lipid A disaccharide synthetase